MWIFLRKSNLHQGLKEVCILKQILVVILVFIQKFTTSKFIHHYPTYFLSIPYPRHDNIYKTLASQNLSWRLHSIGRKKMTALKKDLDLCFWFSAVICVFGFLQSIERSQLLHLKSTTMATFRTMVKIDITNYQVLFL